MKNKETLNDEQLKTAVKEAGIGAFMLFRIWAFPYNDPNPREIFVSAERWFDARAFGIKYLGVPELNIENVTEQLTGFPRFQLRWVGNASTANKSLRMQYREYAMKKTKGSLSLKWSPWKDVE